MDAAAALNGLFGFAAIVGGLFCARLKTAVIVGVVIALVYSGLILAALVTAAGTEVSEPAFLSGRLVGAGLAFVIFAVLAHLVRRGVGALFRRKPAGG